MSATQQLEVIKQKRDAIEKLIAIARGLKQQSQALDDLIYLSRPSQKMPDRLVKYVKLIESQVATLNIQEVQNKLTQIDKNIRLTFRLLTKAVEAYAPSEAELQSYLTKNTRIQEKLNLFKKRTQIALGLRIYLQKKGVQVERLEIDIAQDQLLEQASQLREKERHVRATIVNKVTETLKDTKQLLQLDSLPPALRSDLAQLSVALADNLEHLKKGKDIDSLPVSFEHIELATLPHGTPYQSPTITIDEQAKSSQYFDSDYPVPVELKKSTEQKVAMQREQKAEQDIEQPHNGKSDGDPLAALSNRLDIEKPTKKGFWSRFFKH